jgi:acyl carrier protein
VAHSREEILEQVKSALSEKLGIDESEITEDTSFEDDLGADSLDFVEGVMNLEDQFGLRIPDEDARELTTVGKTIDYVIAHEKDLSVIAHETDLSRLAGAVARELQSTGTPLEELQVTIRRTEERSSGFLGRGKTAVTLRDTFSQPFGWRLWRQPLGQILWQLGPENVQEDTSWGELWLRPTGVVEYLFREHTNHQSGQTWETKTQREATVQDFELADRVWLQHEASAGGAQRRNHTWNPSADIARKDLIKERLKHLRSKGGPVS